jgi:hypothetical protein
MNVPSLDRIMKAAVYTTIPLHKEHPQRTSKPVQLRELGRGGFIARGKLHSTLGLFNSSPVSLR